MTAWLTKPGKYQSLPDLGDALGLDVSEMMVPGLNVTNVVRSDTTSDQSIQSSLAIKGPRPWIDARAYGLDAASADNTAAAAAVIAAIPASGANVYIPSGIYAYTGNTTAWDLTDKENVHLFGDSITSAPYSSLGTKGTIFKRTSGTGTLLDWSASTTAMALRGCGIQDIAFDCNTSAAIGVQLRSIYGGTFSRINIREATSVGMVLSTVDLTGTEDLQSCIFEQITVSCSATAGAKGMTLSSWAAGGGNVSINNFHRIIIYTQNGTGIECGDSDTNTFVGVECNRSGTAVGIDLLGSTSGVGQGHCRHNSFYHVDSSGGVTSRNNTTPASRNYVFLSRGNSTPAPTIEAGSSLVWFDDNGNESPDRAMVGSGVYGMDYNGATLSGGAIRLPNNVSVVGRNAAGSADINAFKISTLNEMDIPGPVRFSGTGGIVVGNTNNLILSTSTGTKIGTGTTQKLGLWNATPVVQPSGTGETVGFTAGAGTNVTDASTFTGNVGSTAYRISDIVKALKQIGALAA